MMKTRDISSPISNTWIKREAIDIQWKRFIKSHLPILLVGPPGAGKYEYVYQKYWADCSQWKNSEENRNNPSCLTAIFIHFLEYEAIQSKEIFFYRLQKEILSQFANHIDDQDNRLIKAFEDRTGFIPGSAFDFFRSFSELLATKDFYFAGKINIYFCGIQYISSQVISQAFLEYLRAFIDYVAGNPLLERFSLVLTSLVDGYHLTDKADNLCSPLNAAQRIYLNDLTKDEFSRFIDLVEKDCKMEVADREYLFSLTGGDIYLAKVILSFCQDNILDSPIIQSRVSRKIEKSLIDNAVDYILNPPHGELLTPFQVLIQFLDRYEDVREVLYTLHFGKEMVPMTDISGVFTLPESSGAVIKVEEKGKYGYIFRNEIYRRFIEQYIQRQEQKVEAIISQTIGKGDMSFPSTLASAIRHELSGPIGIIAAELSRLFKSPNMSGDDIECLKAIQMENLRIAAINSFLEGSWGRLRNREKVVFNKYIQDNVSLFSAHLRRSNICLRFEFDNRINMIETDTGALKVSLINLVLNARDAILPRSGGTILIKTELRDQGIALVVKDDGIGMDRYTLNQILEYGFSTKQNGRGIGLSLCKTAVRRMNAFLDVDSTEGKGSTISITIRRENNEDQKNPIDRR